MEDVRQRNRNEREMQRGEGREDTYMFLGALKREARNSLSRDQERTPFSSISLSETHTHNTFSLYFRPMKPLIQPHQFRTLNKTKGEVGTKGGRRNAIEYAAYTTKHRLKIGSGGLYNT